MTDRPILFSGPMVRAILDGRKTQTRRVLKPQPFPVGGPFYRPSPMVAPREWHSVSKAGNIANIQKLPYAEGAELWVREKFCIGFDLDDNDCPVGDQKVLYAASFGGSWYDPDREETRDSPPWKPSIYMPRWASRITLEVTGVKVERLQDISEEDAIEEGVEPILVPPDGGSAPHVEGYRDLWTSINGPGSWEDNPWVAAYSFKRVKP